MPPSRPRSPEIDKGDHREAKIAADRLFDMIGILSPGDPQVFCAAVVALMSHYPASVLRAVIDPHSGIPGRRAEKKPWQTEIEFYKQVLDELYAPILADRERERRVEAMKSLAPPPPRTPEEQARIDAQVAAWRKANGLPAEGTRRRSAYRPMVEAGDGKHAQRVLADLAARRARKQANSEEEPPPISSANGDHHAA